MRTISTMACVLVAALGGCTFEPGGATDPGDPGGPDSGPAIEPGVDVDAGPVPVEPVPQPPSVVCTVVDESVGVTGLNVQAGATVVTFKAWEPTPTHTDRFVGFTLAPSASGLRYEVRVGRDRYVTEGLTFTIPAGPGQIDRVDFCVTQADEDGRR